MKKLLTVLFAFVMLFSLLAGAITLDTAESAAEVKSEEAVAEVQETALDIPTEDPYYGKLVYYNNFEEASGFTVGESVVAEDNRNLFTYKDTDFVGKMKMGNGGANASMNVVTLANGANANNQALEISPNVANSYPQLYFDSDYMENKGIFTFVADIRSKSQNIGVSFGWAQNGNGRNDNNIGTATASGWKTGAREYKLVTRHDAIAQGATQTNGSWSKDPLFSLGTGGMFFIHVPNGATAANYTYYLDNIRIYFKEYPEYVMNATEGYTYNFGFGKALDMDKTAIDLGNTEAIVTLDAETGKGSVKSSGYAGVVTINAVFTDGKTDTKVVRLYSGTKWKPGLNVFTGTTGVVDFDKVIQSDYNKVFTGNALLAANPDKNGNDANVIAYVQSQFNYLYSAADLETPIELERTVNYKFDMKGSKNGYIVINGGGGNNLYTYPAASSTWVTREYNINLANGKGAMQNNAWGNGIKALGVGGQSGTYGYETAGYIYYDNFSFIPYYKATYMNWDGSAAFNLQYFLKDANGNLMTVYTPYNKNTLAAPWEGEGYKEFIGWSTTKGATEAMTSIPLEYKDLVLYPVYRDTTAVATNTVLNGASGKNGGVFFNKKLNTDETTVNVGTTEATYAYNNANNCMVIAGAGYSGIVTINAVFFDGTTETVKVQLIGGEKWRPGLNLITGTTDTFAVNSEYEAGLAFTFDPGTGVVADPFTGEGYALYLGGVANIRYPVITSKMTQQIEAGRSVLTVFDYSGKWNNFWIIGQPNVPFNDLSGALKQNTGEWLNVVTATSKGGKNFTVTRFQTDAGSTGAKGPLYLDNIAFIPYYKATYMNADGSVLATEYFLRDAAGKIMTAYTPNKTAEWTGEGKKLLTGWSTTEGGEVTETVALANADITLYPVFEDAYTVSFYGFDGEVAKEDVVLAGEYAIDYILADENGKYFEGWKVEGTDEIVTSVNVEADVKLYPVYTAKAEDTVENVEGNEMRFDVVDGNVVSSIRFKAVISASERNAADEYGFIVTRKTFLDTMAEKAANGEAVETDLTFDFKFGGNNLFAYGAAYVADSDLDLNLGEDENGAVTFAAALSGIKNNDANHANEVMVARPYVKFTNNGKQYVFYGAKASASLVDVAKSVDTTNLPENYKKNIEDIVALAK